MWRRMAIWRRIDATTVGLKVSILPAIERNNEPRVIGASVLDFGLFLSVNDFKLWLESNIL
jgi:hypothetical protein